MSLRVANATAASPIWVKVSDFPCLFEMSLAPAELFPKISTDGFDNDTLKRCCEQRNRRILIRHLRSGPGPGPGPGHSLSNDLTLNQEIRLENSDPGLTLTVSRVITLGAPPLPLRPSQIPLVAEESSFSYFVRGPVEINLMPIRCWISIHGLAQSKDDMLMVKEGFCRVAGNYISGQPMHYFAVYDGHGGPRVSTLCKNVLHTLIVEEVMLVWTAKRAVATENRSNRYSCNYSSAQEKQRLELSELKREWRDMVRAALEKSFQRMDQMACNTCSCGNIVYICCCKPIELIFAGSTAMVAC